MMNKFVFTNSIAGGGTFEHHIINLPKLMSSANRKTFDNVDLSGNAQLYTVALTPSSTKSALSVFGASNTYVTKRAIKGFHEGRKRMFERIGLKLTDLGPYARTLRPYLSVNHQNGTYSEGSTLPVFAGSEWTYSSAATTPPADDSHTTTILERDLVDLYTFTLCDNSVPASTQNNTEQNFESVGIISEWLDSFKRPNKGGFADSETIDSNNILLQLMSDRLSSEEVLEIAEEAQKERMPWDSSGSSYINEQLLDYVICTEHQSPRAIVQVPCGLLRLTQENIHGTSGDTDNCHVKMEVLAIEDM